MNELDLLKGLKDIFQIRNNVALGIGDDCAAIEYDNKHLMLLASDQLISGVHFPDDTPPEKAAAKLLKRNLSDIAAMGGSPQHALLNLAVNAYDGQWIRCFFQGLEACAREYNVCVCGGDLASLKHNSNMNKNTLVASLTITGIVDKKNLCLRSAARAGDLLCVTGTLGDSFSSGKHLDFTPRLSEGHFLAGTFTHCMIDISDGLLLDASRLAEASNLDIELSCADIPLNNCTLAQALGDGEDYELLFAVSEEKFPVLKAQWPFDIPLSRIGVFHTKRGAESCVYDAADYKALLDKFDGGYIHR